MTLTSMMRLPRMNTVVYNQIETVIFQNGSNRVMFYDKERECPAKRCSQDVIRRAAGVLKLEISPPVHLMREYARRRIAADLLTMKFCRYVTNRVLPLLRFTMSDEFPSEWIQSHPIGQIETALGFIQLYKRFGEGGLRQLFTTSTLRNRICEMERGDGSIRAVTSGNIITISPNGTINIYLRNSDKSQGALLLTKIGAGD